MITIHFVASSALSTVVTTTIQCKPGQSLMQAAVAANIAGIEADCGGLLTCATCHVMVREPHAGLLPPPDCEELGMLDFTASSRQANSRLSCQIQLTEALDGLTVDLPVSQH
jgi:2Fe-2S ferredoxin